MRNKGPCGQWEKFSRKLIFTHYLVCLWLGWANESCMELQLWRACQSLWISQVLYFWPYLISQICNLQLISYIVNKRCSRFVALSQRKKINWWSFLIFTYFDRRKQALFDVAIICLSIVVQLLNEKTVFLIKQTLLYVYVNIQPRLLRISWNS